MVLNLIVPIKGKGKSHKSDQRFLPVEWAWAAKLEIEIPEKTQFFAIFQNLKFL